MRSTKTLLSTACDSVLAFCVLIVACVSCGEPSQKPPPQSQKPPSLQVIRLDDTNPPKEFSDETAKSLLAGSIGKDNLVNAEYQRMPKRAFYADNSWCPGYPTATVNLDDAKALLAMFSNASTKQPYDPNNPEFDPDNLRHVGNLFMSLEDGTKGCLKIYDVLYSDYYYFCPCGSFPSNWGPYVRFVAKPLVPIASWNQQAQVNPEVPLLFPDLADEEVDAIAQKKFGVLYKRARQFIVDSIVVKQNLGVVERIHPAVGPNNSVANLTGATGKFTFWLRGKDGEGLVTVQVPGPSAHPNARITGRLLITKSERDEPGRVGIDLNHNE